MIGRVKTRPFEDHAAAASDQTHQFGLAALGALFQPGFGHGLQGFKGMLTIFAFVLIGWHIVPLRYRLLGMVGERNFNRSTKLLKNLQFWVIFVMI